MIIHNKTNFDILIDNRVLPAKSKTKLSKIVDTDKLLRLQNSGKVVVYNTGSHKKAQSKSLIDDSVDTSSVSTDLDKKTNKKSAKKDKVDTINNESC